MKKIFLIISFYTSCICMLTSCVDEAIVLDEDKGSQTTEGEASRAGEVEIELGASMNSMSSRASIESNGDGFFVTNKNDVLGVFALATDIIQENTTNYNNVSIDWKGEWTTNPHTGKPLFVRHNDPYSVYLKNARAGISYRYDGTDIVGSRVQFLDAPNGKVFYPMSSLHKYSFYAYNPRVDSIVYSANKVVAVMKDLKGCEDVIWGCVEPQNNDKYLIYAYSAEYFRMRENIKNKEEILADMTFRFTHKMMRLTFDIVAGAEDENIEEPTLRNYDKAYKTRLHSISIQNVPDEVELVLADKTVGTYEAPNQQGMLTYSSSRNKAYYLKEKRKNAEGKDVLDSLLAPVCPVPANPAYAQGNRDETNVPAVTRIGQGIILPALTEEDKQSKPYIMQVVIEDAQGSFHKKSFTLDASKGKFEAGKSYNLTLKIYSWDRIRIDGTASEWDSFGEDDYLDNVDPLLKEQIEREKKEEEEKRRQEEEEKRKQEE